MPRFWEFESLCQEAIAGDCSLLHSRAGRRRLLLKANRVPWASPATSAPWRRALLSEGLFLLPRAAETPFPIWGGCANAHHRASMPSFTLAHQYNTRRQPPPGLLTDAHHPQLAVGESLVRRADIHCLLQGSLFALTVCFLLAERKRCGHGGFNNSLLSTQAGAEGKAGGTAGACWSCPALCEHGGAIVRCEGVCTRGGLQTPSVSEYDLWAGRGYLCCWLTASFGVDNPCYAKKPWGVSGAQIHVYTKLHACVHAYTSPYTRARIVACVFQAGVSHPGQQLEEALQVLQSLRAWGKSLPAPLHLAVPFSLAQVHVWT